MSTDDQSVPVVLGARLDDSAPIACTLTADDLPARLAEWESVLDHVEERTPIDDGLRLSFDQQLELPELARLVAAEQTCCSFFGFAITVDHRGTALEVRAPADAAELLDGLFG